MDIEDKRLQKLIKGYRERGIIQQIAMDLLHQVGGLSRTDIGEMMGVDYSTMSVGRKRLREKLKGDKHLFLIIKKVKADLSTIKI
jgi:chromosomal replication initiation ATPase DnaA